MQKLKPVTLCTQNGPMDMHSVLHQTDRTNFQCFMFNATSYSVGITFIFKLLAQYDNIHPNTSYTVYRN